MLKKAMLMIAGGFFLLSAFTLKADVPDSNFALIGGYKRANINTPLSVNSDSEGFIGEYPTRIKGIKIWQIGASARYAFPDFFASCGCDSSWLKQFYLRGSFLIGKVEGGRYKLTTKAVNEPEIVDTSSVKKGYSRDYDIALGWLYPWCDNFGIGPVIGYNYDKIKTKAGKFKSQDGERVEGIDHLRYISRFKGGYVGVDLAYYACNWKLFAGYEYHMPVWSGNWKLPRFDNDDGFSDKRNCGHGHGNVFYVDGRYQFCGCWEIGLIYRYENYRSGKGRARPVCCGDCTGIAADEVDTIRTKYHAWS
ncbi:MAG: hypothetical protein ACK4HV_08730, partial [Parachlamydiaceae bacterium]